MIRSTVFTSIYDLRNSHWLMISLPVNLTHSTTESGKDGFVLGASRWKRETVHLLDVPLSSKIWAFALLPPPGLAERRLHLREKLSSLWFGFTVLAQLSSCFMASLTIWICLLPLDPFLRNVAVFRFTVAKYDWVLTSAGPESVRQLMESSAISEDVLGVRFCLWFNNKIRSGQEHAFRVNHPIRKGAKICHITS